MVLAYSFLLNNPEGLTAQALDEQIEAWFQEHYQCVLDFEISDALDKLKRLQLTEVKQGVYHAVALAQAKKILDAHWDNLFNY